MPIALDPRKKPAGVKIHVTSGAGVDVEWSDGHKSHYDFLYLRENCPCALCNDEREKKRQFGEAQGSGGGGADPFPMYKPKVTAKSAKSVGHYAIQFEFSDGHSTGIYSFDHLRDICPCEECGRAFR